jgi:hypothetical protein
VVAENFTLLGRKTDFEEDGGADEENINVQGE